MTRRARFLLLLVLAMKLTVRSTAGSLHDDSFPDSMQLQRADRDDDVTSWLPRDLEPLHYRYAFDSTGDMNLAT